MKHQTPNTKHQNNPKLQTSNPQPDDCVGIWYLELLWSLVFGFWRFAQP